MLACAGLASLGSWQLRRAEEKRARHDVYAARQAASPLAFERIPAQPSLADYGWRRITVRGHFLDLYVVLDNRVQQGRVGYEVLTPFAADSGRTLLVDRGWTALPDDRSALPEVLAPADPATLTGYIGAEPTVGIDLTHGAHDAEIMSPQIFRVQRVDLPGLAGVLNRELWPGILYLDAGAFGALAVEWPLPGDDSSRHTAYAVQWFAMSAALGAIGLWNLYGRQRS